MGALARLLRLVAPQAGWMGLAALLGFATVGSGVGLMATAAFIIAAAALHPSVADLAVAIVGVRFFGISRGVFRYLERYVSHRVTFRLLARLRVWFYTAIEPLAPAGLAGERTGDLLARMVSDVETLQHFYVRALAPPLVALLTAGLMALFLGAFDLGLALALLLLLALGGVALPLLTARLGATPGRQMAVARGDLGARAVDGIQGLADLAAAGREGDYLADFRLLNDHLAWAETRQARLAGLHGGLSTLTAHLGLWVMLVLGIPLVAAGRMEGVYLPVVALAALAAFEAVAPLPLAFQYLGHSLAAAGRLFGVVDRSVDSSLVTGAKSVGAGVLPARPAGYSGYDQTAGQNVRPYGLLGTSSAVRGTGEGSLPVGEGPGVGLAPHLRVADLRFRYALEEAWALDGVSFTVPRGGHLAIVGPSGAGKSTIANLLMRFHDAEEGTIALDGVDIRALPAEEVRRQVALVAQRTHLFNASVRENLLLAKPEASETEMVAAAEQAQLHAFVRSLPRGYDTWVGEQGLRLSAGERQRVAVARALLKDAPLLLLDEATANLDILTERALLGALRDGREGRTILSITHRLVGLEEADEVIVLDEGKIVERGTHADLLASGGLYRRMWDLQRQALPAEWK